MGPFSSGTPRIRDSSAPQARPAGEGNLFFPSTVSGLPKDSVVNVTQLLTLDTDDLGARVGRLPSTMQLELDAGLRRVLDL